MTAPHKATPEQWENMEEWGIQPGVPSYSSVILELRDRIEALEAAANRRAILGSSPAPAGGLVEQVGAAICTIDDCGSTPSNWAPEARAAILAVAKWFDTIGYGATASILRQELQRHA